MSHNTFMKLMPPQSSASCTEVDDPFTAAMQPALSIVKLENNKHMKSKTGKKILLAIVSPILCIQCLIIFLEKIFKQKESSTTSLSHNVLALLSKVANILHNTEQGSLKLRHCISFHVTAILLSQFALFQKYIQSFS